MQAISLHRFQVRREQGSHSALAHGRPHFTTVLPVLLCDQMAYATGGISEVVEIDLMLDAFLALKDFA